MTKLQQQLDQLEQGAAPRRRRAVRPAGAAQEVSGPAHAGEESAAVRGGVERDRRHAQARQGARGLGAQEHDRGGGAAETARRAQRRSCDLKSRYDTRTTNGSTPSATCAPKPKPAGRPTQIESTLPERLKNEFLKIYQTAAGRRGGARRERHLQLLPHARPPGARAAAQARRAGALRRLPPHSLPGATHILKITAFVDGAARGNPGPAGYGVFMTTDDGEIIEICGYLGTTTNNVAEYAGLLEALAVAQRKGRPRSRSSRTPSCS
jgi:hypothetical protein